MGDHEKYMSSTSEQYKILEKEWQADKEGITQRIIKEANACLKQRVQDEKMQPFDDWLPYCCHDGIFDVFAEDSPYNKVCSEEGNAGDDCIYLANVWCLVLVKTGNPAYLPIIRKQLEINVEGL